MTRAILVVSAALALAMPTEARSKASTVQCQDGTTSKAGRGACAHHGGIASAAEAESGKGSASASAKSHSKSARKSSSKARASRSGETAAGRAPEANDTSSGSGGFLGRLMGRSAPAPRRTEPAQRQGAPTARCNDGTTSYSQHHSGTCSGHGGVAQWLDQR
jgi:hypothetical protein